MKIPAPLNSVVNHFRPRGGPIDVLRDPYKVWFRLSIIFLVLLIVVAALDGYIFYKARTGGLVKTVAVVSVPPPIIEEGALAATARTFTNEVLALTALQRGAASSTVILDPSQ